MENTFNSIVETSKKYGISYLFDNPDKALYNLLFNTEDYKPEIQLDNETIESLTIRGGYSKNIFEER